MQTPNTSELITFTPLQSQRWYENYLNTSVRSLAILSNDEKVSVGLHRKPIAEE